jgi:hypothetical protein
MDDLLHLVEDRLALGPVPFGRFLLEEAVDVRVSP